MYTTTAIQPDGTCRAAAPLEGIEVYAENRDEAMELLDATVRVWWMALGRLKLLRKMTTIEYEPNRGCYTAKCWPAGFGVNGRTREQAWTTLLAAICLVDKAATNQSLTDIPENNGKVQEDS